MSTGNKLKQRELRSFKINKTKLKGIVKVLFSENRKAQELEFKQFRKSEINDELTDQKLSKIVEQNMNVTIHIWGREGEYKYEQGVDNIDDIAWPPKVEMITIENFNQFFSIYNRRPVNNFFVKFDFSHTDIFDLITLPSNKTENDSKYEVLGTDPGWVHGVESQLNELIKPYENDFLNFLHTRNIYDLLAWVLYVPAFLYSMSNWSQKYPLIQNHIIEPMQPICFIAVLIMGLYLFRIFFNISKRIFPFSSLEGDLKDPKDIWYWGRGFLYFGITSIIGTILSGLFS